jgi:hypothetical protein
MQQELQQLVSISDKEETQEDIDLNCASDCDSTYLPSSLSVNIN